LQNLVTENDPCLVSEGTADDRHGAAGRSDRGNNAGQVRRTGYGWYIEKRQEYPQEKMSSYHGFSLTG
jgi:hypothetical protein